MEHFRLVTFSFKDWKQGSWWRQQWEGWERRMEKDKRIGIVVQTREWEPEEAGQGDLGL